MARGYNTDAHGKPFDDETVAAVWEKATAINGFPPAEWRRDRCGRVIRRSAYGDPTSSLGWEVDHYKPAVKGGSDDMVNLQPLHWAMNREKGDKYPWSCP